MTEAVEGEVHSFIAGEFSNMIWGFYLLKYLEVRIINYD